MGLDGFQGREAYVDRGRVACPLRGCGDENVETCLGCAYVRAVAQEGGRVVAVRCAVPRLEALQPNFR